MKAGRTLRILSVLNHYLLENLDNLEVSVVNSIVQAVETLLV